MFAGARWVATRACKAVRPPGRLFGDPARGSYLATVWLLPGMQGEWDDVGRRDAYAATPPERLFAGREHLHTAVYGYDWDVARRRRAAARDRARPRLRGRDRDRDDRRRGASGADDLVGPDLPLAVGFAPERVIMSSANPGPHDAWCSASAPATRSAPGHAVAPMLANRTDVGFAGPFLRTIPGTDTYVDEL